MANELNLHKSEGPMSNNGGIEVLEHIILGKTKSVEKPPTYSIFLTGTEGEKGLLPSYLIELLLVFDSGIYDIDTISELFDVSIEDVLLFTESYPGYGKAWEESIATKWTKFFNFYEDDLEDLAWISRYAIKRADVAIGMGKSLIEATTEMAEELREDDGWTESTTVLRVEGIAEQEKRVKILSFWLDRSALEGDLDGNNTST